MKKIVGIGYSMPSGQEDDYVRFDSLGSLSDYDIVIFNPELHKTIYDSDSQSPSYHGDTLYSKSSSNSIKKHFDHWEKEIENFLNSGKNVFVNLCPLKNFYVYSGTKDVSGTGRNQKITEHVRPKTNYDFLPINFKISNSSGKIVLPVNNLIKPYFNGLKSILTYEAHIQLEGIETLFTTKNKDKILGGVYKQNKGNIILLPYLDFDHSRFSDYDENEKEIWTDEALKYGQIFINNIVSLDKSLNSGYEKTPKPDWIKHKSYHLEKAEKIKIEIQEINKKIEDLKNAEDKLKSNLLEEEILKDLLFETGKPLEKAVIKALELIGYQAENFDDGTLELDQVITSPEGDRFIGECEGKDNKAIDIGKFRQLQDSMNEDFYREEINEKAFGLLFGNPERLVSPSKRKFTFTDKCKKGAKREGIGVIKTAELFKVAKYLSENNDEEYKTLCRKVIKEQLGEIIDFPKIK
jgi:hypothetical protein